MASVENQVKCVEQTLDSSQPYVTKKKLEQTHIVSKRQGEDVLMRRTVRVKCKQISSPRQETWFR